jgi:clan AA aspartic protease
MIWAEDAVGTFSVTVQIGDIARRRYQPLEAIVDTGATYTVVPATLLHTLGIQRLERRKFEMADQRVVEFDVGEVRLRLDGREQTVLAVFGPEDATPLLGATTLELFGLGVDPVGQRLVPVPGLLK